MKLSPSAKATLKRFAWLWGALLGAVLLPVLMAVCNYGAATYFPLPTAYISVTNHSLPAFLGGIVTRMWFYGPVSGAIGGCCAMLWVGNRSWTWRVLSLLVGGGATIFFLRTLWSYWIFSATGILKPWDYTIYVASYAPLLLAGSLLVFFALLLRAPRASAIKA